MTTPADTTPPAVPADVVATPRPGAVSVTWNPSTDVVADDDLSGFRVYRADSPGGPYGMVADLADPAAGGYQDAGLVDGRSYYYVVSAYDDESAANESAYSNEAQATPYFRLSGGLAADYYDSTNDGTWHWFGTLKASRVDATVDFNWEQVVPPAGRYIKGLYGTTYHWCLFGARWQGELLADYDESYTLEIQNLDGARLWIDGQLAIDDWDGWFTHTNSAQLALTAGWHAVRLDYYRYHPEAGEDGLVQLYYSSPSTTRRIVPADHLATVTDVCSPDCAGRQCGDDGCGGTCGSCAADRMCDVQGQCVCPAGTSDCSGACVNLASDPSNCGSCGNGCATGESCSGGKCGAACPDADGDGHADANCGGDDCDDASADVHPGAAEICSDGLDNDCDGLTDVDDTVDCGAEPDGGDAGGDVQSDAGMDAGADNQADAATDGGADAAADRSGSLNGGCSCRNAGAAGRPWLWLFILAACMLERLQRRRYRA